jgi:Glycosyl hydrolases family 2, sugar binding domain/Glycosyl hydrolases family 2/Glycosyl hydrolases family 2, TIM barrel domain
MRVIDLTNVRRIPALLLLTAGLGLLGTSLLAQVPWQMKQAPLMTQWAALVDTNAPLPEYPRPQLVRTNWLNLNGIWQFQSGTTNDPVPAGQTLSNQILVPYPMESAISGIMQYYEFSWYRRTFTVPSTWSGKHIILHLDAVDWQATVYVNGQEVGRHKGGYDPISYDITSYLNGGTNELIVNVYSPEDNGGEPRGKQTLYPGGVMYTSSSGIWQPAWLEPVDASGVSSLQMVPDIDTSQLQLTVNTYATAGVTVMATVLSNGVALNNVTGSPNTRLDIPVPNENLWSPTNPSLYNLQISVVHNGVTVDNVASYFGMRKISVNLVAGRWRLFLNNQFLFEIGPLDQGFWPDGVYTAPTDAALAYDIQMEKAMGFNMVRKHLKVERQRWYYWADTLGLLVWQDMPSCNTYTGNPNPPAVDPLDFMAELSAMVTNHWNSPSIIMWDVFNEGNGEAGTYNGVDQTNTAYLVQLVQTLDPSRLVNQASGWNWVGAGSVDDIHNYPDPGNPIDNTLASLDGEFGSVGYVVPGHMWFGTGYPFGSAFTVSTTNELISYYDYYANELISYEPSAKGGLNGGVYTEITDMETESAGLMTYDRLLKVNPSLISRANQKVILANDIITNVVAVTTNFSFEEDVAAPGTAFTEVPSGWSAFNEGSEGDIGSQNAGGVDYAVFDPLAPPANGNQYCYINMFDSSVTGGIYTDVGPMQTNTIYTLTVAIGSREDRINSPGIISLISGSDNTGTIMASGGGLPARQNTWRDYSISFTNGVSAADLTIALSVIGNGTTIQADFDNVRLAATPAPIPVTVNNPSFEENVAGGPRQLVGGTPTGWTSFNQVATGDIGSQWAGGSDYTVYDPLAAPAFGNQYCYINLYNNPNSSTGIYQDAGALQANTLYRLTVAIGSRNDIQTLPGIISLVNGTNNAGTVLSSTNGVPATQNTWQDETVSFTTGYSVSGDLTVELWVDPTLTGSVPSGVNNIQGDFDNVQLTATPIVVVFNAPTLGAPIVSGGSLILTGTGGTPNAGYTWLVTTNLSAPINWTTNIIGNLDRNGAFSNTVPINPSQPANFFRLRIP